MPLPAAWHAMPNVGAARDQGSGADACAHPQIGSLLWRGQSEYRQVRTRHVREIRCRYVRDLPEETPTTSFSGHAHGGRARQRQVPPRNTSQAPAAEISRRAQLAVSTAVQSAAGAHRAGLEAGPPNGYAQPFLRHIGRIAHCGRQMLQPLATTQFGAA